MKTTIIKNNRDGDKDLSWLLETHCKEMAGRGFKFAILYGNEDSPTKVEFWKSPCPRYDLPPDFIWFPSNSD